MVCSELGKKDCRFRFDETFWINLEIIVKTLEFPYAATKEMQKVNYTLSDFYASWLRMKLSLEEIKHDSPQFNLAHNLLDCMKERRAQLFDNPAMLCALYLDSRFRTELTATQAQAAKFSLLKLLKEMEAKKQAAKENDNIDIVDKYLSSKHSQHSSIEDDFAKEIERYEQLPPQLTSKFSVIDFWVNNEERFPILSELANIIFGIPCTQTSVERSFSAFSYIFSNFRQKMDPENMQNVLLVRLNKDLFYEENQEQIEKIIEKYRSSP